MSDAGRLTVAVASGKGGTGKTLVATNLAAAEARAGRRVVLVDCDAEAPNDHLFLPQHQATVDDVETMTAEVDSDSCTACGSCSAACAYGAIRVLGDTALVFEELCHGCGLCEAVCPESAVTERARVVGEVTTGQVTGIEDLTLVTARMAVGEVKTPTVIRAARESSESVPGKLAVLDAPPGVACAAVAATRGADVLLLVTEPTAFGLHDLELSVMLGRKLAIPVAVVVNRDAPRMLDVDAACAGWGVPVIGRIRFQRSVAESYARGDLLVDRDPRMARWFERLAGRLRAPGEAHADSRTRQSVT